MTGIGDRGTRVRRPIDGTDPYICSGRAVQEVTELVDAVLHYCIRPLIGASAPGHHGYQRACDLILGQASNGLVGSPVFARAGKTDHSIVVSSSRRPRRVTLAKLGHR